MGLEESEAMSAGDATRSVGEFRIDRDQHALLRRCIDAGDAAEWNRWRAEHPEVEIWLQGADLTGTVDGRSQLRRVNLRAAHLSRANVRGAVLVGADFTGATMKGLDARGAILVGAHLRNASLDEADLTGTNLNGADLRGGRYRFAKVDGDSLIQTPLVDPQTDFTGVALESARVEPGLLQLLQYNVRRGRWREWYQTHPRLAMPVRLFWMACDYGHSTWRIVISFAVLAVVFAIAYSLLPDCLVAPSAARRGEFLDFGYSLYFSIVTMTTLGFGDVCASPNSHLGQFLLCCQVVLGYLLLGALVTRFAVLFTGGGPPASFASGDKQTGKDGPRRPERVRHAPSDRETP